MSFLPREHPTPAGVRHERVVVPPITIDDVVEHDEAVTTSAARLRERVPPPSRDRDALPERGA